MNHLPNVTVAPPHSSRRLAGARGGVDRWRRGLVTLALAGAAGHTGACASAQPPTGQIAGETSVVELPAMFHGTHVFVLTYVAGGDSVWMLLDSGAQISVLDLRTATAAGVSVSSSSTVTGYGADTLRGGVTSPVSVRMPGTNAYTLQMPAIDLSGIEPYLGRRVAGILGADLFQRFVVEIDYPRSRVRLHEPTGFQPTDAGELVPLRVMDRLPYVDAIMELPDGKRLSGTLVVDIGSGSGVSFTGPFVSNENMMPSMGPTLPGRSVGLGGESQSAIGRLRTVHIGDVPIDRPVAQLALDRNGTAAGARAGAIGGDILSRFKVTLDYRRGALYLDPGEEHGRPFLAAAAGAGIVAEGEQLRQYRVWYVDVESAAAMAGLRADDVISSVNGTPASDFILPEIRGFLAGERGETVRLGILRDGNALAVELRLPQRI